MRQARLDEAVVADSAPVTSWLDLDTVSTVSITARGERISRTPSLWSAECPGEQLIEVRFHQPTPVRRLRVVTIEAEQSRTQEMTLWVSSGRGERHREVLRQQFNFSPDGATRQVEEYALELDDVAALQLRIVPSIDGRPATARVSELRIASSDAPTRVVARYTKGRSRRSAHEGTR